MKTKPDIEFNEKKCRYLSPLIEISVFEVDKDILCMSKESYDNEFDAGGLGADFNK